MDRKRNIEGERALRRLDAKRKRLERVMSGYIFYTHPEIYAEGVKFYNTLDAIYPNKKDLRKTPQFMALQQTIPPYNIVEKSKVLQVTEKKRTVKDSFVLEIPLVKRKTAVQQTSTITRAMKTVATTSATETTATTSAPETSTSTSATETVATTSATETTATTSAPEMSTSTSAAETVATTSATETAATTSAMGTTADTNAVVESTGSGTTDLLAVDDVTLQQIIEELKSDTCLYQFFNDMNYGLSLDPELDIDISDMSPLEQELLN